mgnify:CR=1 FL=1
MFMQIIVSLAYSVYCIDHHQKDWLRLLWGFQSPFRFYYICGMIKYRTWNYMKSSFLRRHKSSNWQWMKNESCILTSFTGSLMFFALLGLSGCLITCYDRRVRNDLAQPCRELCVCCCHSGFCSTPYLFIVNEKGKVTVRFKNCKY